MDHPTPNIPKLPYIFDSHLQPLSVTCYKHTSFLVAGLINITVSWRPTHQHTVSWRLGTSKFLSLDGQHINILSWGSQHDYIPVSAELLHD